MKLNDTLKLSNTTSPEIVGTSSSTDRLRDEISRVAPFSSNVLITGPSGSGKELVARSVHAQSLRAAELFIPVDCASLYGELMASQLFGHEAGAFTGANYAALGCFRAADRGTIFLDEIGELELPLQAKLLRVIQERVVTPVGSHQGVPIDVRIVAATNRNLQEEVAAGRFREDLFYRLNVVSIHTTPLRERPGDVPVLARRILEEMADHDMPRRQLSPGAIEALESFSWPGNVRQLRNVLEQAVIVSEGPLLSLSLIGELLTTSSPGVIPNVESLPEQLPATPATPCASLEPPQAESDVSWRTLSALEREHILYTLEHTYYNQSAAARLLGVSRQALIRKIKKYGLSLPSRLK